ncbi:MAG: flagellar motor stator protein MotA [Bacteriovoracaceae bacterium]|nr:flagellar motor stator protein MotA [Bacteriovoracaceae bacterium]
MLVILGAIVVMGSVLGGFLLHGGHIMVLYQPTEFLVIGGAGIGSMLISSSPHLLKTMMSNIKDAVLGHGLSKEEYKQVVCFVYECFKMLTANPISMDKHIEDPKNSDLFNRYPAVVHNQHALDFFCDTLKVQLVARLASYDLEDLMDLDINTVHKEEFQVPTLIAKVGDAMPGLGIVAAVLGVVITMGKLTEGKEVIGHSVAAALVGTFLGVLASYGFFQPLASKIETTLSGHSNVINVLKAAISAYTKGCNAKVCAEFARRCIPLETRPTFQEIDEATSQIGKGGGGAAPAAKAA